MLLLLLLQSFMIYFVVVVADVAFRDVVAFDTAVNVVGVDFDDVVDVIAVVVVAEPRN
jgi:hypothetical protein